MGHQRVVRGTAMVGIDRMGHEGHLDHYDVAKGALI